MLALTEERHGDQDDGTEYGGKHASPVERGSFWQRCQELTCQGEGGGVQEEQVADETMFR
jgi:hypothetical protein